MFLYPKVMRKGAQITHTSVAAMRTSPFKIPDQLWMVYIDKQQVLVSSTTRVTTPSKQWDDEFSLGIGKHATVAFDGYWAKDANGRYIMCTDGAPWFGVVRLDGTLELMQGLNEIPMFIDSNVSLVASIRGWRHITDPTKDQGIVFAYLKGDNLYYRTLTPDAQGNMQLDEIYQVPGTPAGITRISMYRTDDFRVGFLCEAAGKIYALTTKRNWVGIGFGDQGTVSVNNPQLVNVTITPISYSSKDLGDAGTTIANVPTGISVHLIRSPLANSFINAYNMDGTTIYVQTSDSMYDIDRSDFAVTDAGNIPFPVINVEKLDGIGAFGAAWLKLTVADFNNAGGNIIVKYTANGSTNDGAGNKWAPFSITFTPVGLVPTYQTPPQPQEVYNLEVPQW